MASEIELKLHCMPDSIDRLGSHPLVSSGVEVGPFEALENTYFDTPDLALHQEQMALRIRATPTEKLQTVKCAANSVAGLSIRPEWETAYAGAFDFGCVDVGKFRDFLQAHQADLVPIFTTFFERRTWRVDVSKKIVILVMADIGYVSSGDLVMPISEVELELVQGKPEDLLDFATALATQLPLIPHDVSKAERGYQLFLKQATSPQKAHPSPLNAKHCTSEAFRLLATQGMRMWQANLLGTLTSDGHEFVHQFRVSLRRLNSLTKVFKTALPRPFESKWSKRLKELSQITGDVRDLDVMRTVILEPLLQSESEEIRQHAKTALDALDHAKKQALLQVQRLYYGGHVLLFARDLHDLDTDGFPKFLPKYAEKQLSGLHRNAVKRLLKTLKSPTPERAHHFRIALKHLRYSCEFFAPLFDNDEMLDYAKAISGLQDTFGFINDFHVALSRLHDWVERQYLPKETREAIALWHAPHAQTVLVDALQLADSVMNRCLPWCTECERRGLTLIRRRMHDSITLQVE